MDVFHTALCTFVMDRPHPTQESPNTVDPEVCITNALLTSPNYRGNGFLLLDPGKLRVIPERRQEALEIIQHALGQNILRWAIEVNQETCQVSKIKLSGPRK